MSLIRGVLLAGNFRTQHELNNMSAGDQRNTLIVELTNHSNQSNYQSFDDDTLAGMGAVLVFLREAKIRTDEELKTLSADDQRNILIVELAAQTGLSGSVLQGMSNMNLVLLGLGKNASSFIRGVLLVGKFRTQHELNGMSEEDQRNTLITEMAGRTNQPGGHFQSLDDSTLAGTGAVLVFLREAKIRSDEDLKTISDDDQRNILIVELAAQTGLSGSVLQGLSNIDLVLEGLGSKRAAAPTFEIRVKKDSLLVYLHINGSRFTPQGTYALTIRNVPRLSEIHDAHSLDEKGEFSWVRSFDYIQIDRNEELSLVVFSGYQRHHQAASFCSKSQVA